MSKKWRPPLEDAGPARPYVAVVFDDPDIYLKVKKELSAVLGQIDFETETFDTSGLSSAYGLVVRRSLRFLSFLRQVGRDELVDIKKKTLNIEINHQHEGRPLVELDPGYVSEYTVVRTALTEDFHRIYLYHGVFAEVLYFTERLSFQPMPHTPNYYRRKDILTVFNDLKLIHISS